MTARRDLRKNKKDFQREFLFRHGEVLAGQGVLSPDALRAGKLRDLLDRLALANAEVPIIVEGKRDCEALRLLGFRGEILTLHGRGGFYDFAEDIHAAFGAVILLLDWDQKGEMLQVQIGALLKGLWEEFGQFRESLKHLCQKDIQDVQGIPSLLERLTGMHVVIGSDTDLRDGLP